MGGNFLPVVYCGCSFYPGIQMNPADRTILTPPKTKTRVLLAVPMRRFNPDNAAADLPKHLQALIALLANSPDLPWSFEMMTFGGGNIARGRNKIVASFLRGPWKWITFIDDDLLPDEDDPAKQAEAMAQALFRILGHKLHVCGALYVTKEENAHWVLNPYREPEIDDKGLLQLPELGTGGMKTYHRSVFEHLIKADSTLAYVCDESRAPEWGFFCQGLMEVDGRRRWLPEDYWMDQLCRRHGIPVHVDTTVRFRHLDTATGLTYPLDGEWPRLPGPTKEAVPPPMVEDYFPKNLIDRILIHAAIGPPLVKFIICLQYWQGDRDAAMRLARFIADLEPVMRDDVELQFFCRHDAHDPDVETLIHVSKKMGAGYQKVLEHTVGYPQSPNFMAMFAMRHVAEAFPDAAGAMLMEADCVPVARDWINQLRADWHQARAAGRLLMGSWRAECTPNGHLNGNLCFVPQLAKLVGLPTVPPKKAWDVALVKYFEPVWCRTGLIANRYCELFVSDEALRTPECGTRAPVLVHGVKDLSAVKYAERVTGIDFQ